MKLTANRNILGYMMAIQLKRAAMIIGLILLVLGMGGFSFSNAQADDGEKSPLASLPLRSIGPAYPSGRISDFAFFSGGHHDYLVGIASGGLWRTQNGGATWTPVFDNEGT